ncbi:MAG TPA: FGGY family carbohydrate kinase [Aggregatilinea sp.]|uniref:xylulokinase n=1 Tax=Aggregatilinea sp. TaxID=2806333 RepID=UPI002BF44F7A|nr:FGGY family carbohydrate kinase [Aggregatilinea sp.]HML20620.1 FGGY family carbohydrate kinase [Aggregatilinea sp.]
MAHRYLITIDVGTSSTKTALWDEAGRTLADASSAYPLRRPDPLWAEIEGATWWAAVCATVREVIAAGGVDPRDVAGIGIDAVSWTLIPVDRAMNALAPAMIWLDRRAGAEAAQLQALPEADRLVSLNANPLDPAYITPKLLWLKAHRPDVFDAAYRFLDATGYIVGRFTGEFVCDTTQAYGYHFFDMRRDVWDAGAAGTIGVPLDKMPRLCPSTEIVGAVTAQAAADTGLAAGIPVLAGCLDAASGALGAGLTRLGQTNEQGGQAGGMAVSLDRVVVEPRLIFSHHVVPGQYILQAGTVGGGSLGWFRDTLGQVEASAGALLGRSPFELFSQQVDAAPAGAHGLIFLPYMAGERTPLWSSVARGVFFGLSYTTTRADLLRAIMEGCAFAVYDNLQIAEEHGVHVTEYLGSGGATQSAVWCQIKADIYGRPFIVARRADGGEGGHSLGLYALTAFAVGLADDIGACVERLLPQRQVYEPSPEHHAMYEDLFGVYRSVSRKALDDFERLDAIARKHGLAGQAI